MTYPVDLLIGGKIEKGSIQLILINFVDICPTLAPSAKHQSRSDNYVASFANQAKPSKVRQSYVHQLLYKRQSSSIVKVTVRMATFRFANDARLRWLRRLQSRPVCTSATPCFADDTNNDRAWHQSRSDKGLPRRTQRTINKRRGKATVKEVAWQ